MRKVLAFLVFFPIAAIAGDDCGKVDSCSYSSKWSNFSRLTVTYSYKNGGGGSTFDYIVKGRESLITFDTKNGKANIYSIPGVATLWRGIDKTGIKTSQACYEDVRDTYAIMESYAVRALFFIGFGVKGGPEKVSDTVNIEWPGSALKLTNNDPGNLQPVNN